MLKIETAVFDRIKQLAYKNLPNEACGYLAGKDGLIAGCYELTNIDKSPEHFSFDPKEQFEALKDARSKGLQIIANFHSHPETPARPSAEDIRLAFDPHIFYGIISLAKPVEVLKFFRIEKGEVSAIEYSIV
jgi:proteasome lid subunit RPN8/RPN11